MAGAPYGNRNAETWTFIKAVRLFHEAIELSNKKANIRGVGQVYKFDFIGEIARELGTYHQMITRHLPHRFPILNRLKTQLLNNLESNCYANGKKGKIKESLAIVNLKSNHKWTDRIDMNQHIDDQRKSVDDLFPPDEEIIAKNKEYKNEQNNGNQDQ